MQGNPVDSQTHDMRSAAVGAPMAVFLKMACHFWERVV
jgi:hypothetical protein